MLRLCSIRANHFVTGTITVASSCTPLRRCWGWWEHYTHPVATSGRQLICSHADRLESEDYGAEHPIASNAVSSGRPHNYC